MLHAPVVAGPVLAVEGVSFSFRQGRQVVQVLKDVNLRVDAGEFVTLIGPSGAGKSTLFRIVAGLLEPPAGRIHLRGGRGGVAYMPQRDCLMPWRTVLGNAALLLELRGVSRREARERALALLPEFGLDGTADRFPHQLSGGMRQRVAFLRTVLGGQELLLLDEPFGALDALTRTAMQDWLLGLWERLHKSVLFITHDVEEAVLLSDRVYVLGGRPATVVGEVRIDLPRPRSTHLVTDPGLVAYRRRLLGLLRGAIA